MPQDMDAQLFTAIVSSLPGGTSDSQGWFVGKLGKVLDKLEFSLYTPITG